MRLVALALVLAACTAPTTPPSEAPEQPFGSLVVEKPDAPLPPGFEILGGACPDPGAIAVQAGCNADGRVGRVYTLAQLGSAGAERPPELAMPAGAVHIPGPMGSAVRVLVDGDRVWVAAPCVPCRVPSEELWVVSLALVTADDLRRLQLLCGLPEAPLLRTADAWDAAIASRTAAR